MDEFVPEIVLIKHSVLNAVVDCRSKHYDLLIRNQQYDSEVHKLEKAKAEMLKDVVKRWVTNHIKEENGGGKFF